MEAAATRRGTFAAGRSRTDVGAVAKLVAGTVVAFERLVAAAARALASLGLEDPDPSGG